MDWQTSITLTRMAIVVLVLSTMFDLEKAETYPADFERRTYFQNFEDVVRLSRISGHLKDNKEIAQLHIILSNNQFLGLNKVVESRNQFGAVHSLVRERKSVIEGRTNNGAGTKGLLTLLEDVDVSNTTTSTPEATSTYSSVATPSTRLYQSTARASNTNSSQLITVTEGLMLTTSTSVIESQCALDTNQLFTNITTSEQWSLMFLDAWGKPGPGLLNLQLKLVGSYRECRSAKAPITNSTGGGGFTGNYCAVGLASSGTGDTIIATLMNSGSVEVGACMPSTCSPDQIFSLFTEGISAANLTSIMRVSSVDCRTDEREYTAATIAAIVLLSIIGALMLLGTAYDILFVQWPKWAATWTNDDDLISGSNEQKDVYHPIQDNEISVEASFVPDDEKHSLKIGGADFTGHKHAKPPTVYSESQPLLNKGHSGGHKKSCCLGILIKVLMSFSVYSNGKKLLNTSQPQGSLGAIHGIRFLSMSWVILGHTYIFSPTSFVNLATAMPRILNRWTFDAVSNALVSVDTFFALSGLLVAYLTTKEIQKKGWKINWAMYYFHRFWRLTPPYMLVLVVSLGLTRFLGSGATWSTTQPVDKTNCEDNWWTNVLYINNFVKTKQMCLAHSWYLANDMQFYILSPLMIVPFYFKLYAGIGTCLMFLLVTWTTTGILSADNNWPNSILNGAVVKEGTLDYMDYYYFAPYCRIGPFVIGILAGYLLAYTKSNIRLKWYYVVIGWVMAFSVGLASVYGIHDDINGGNASTIGMNAFYNAVARSAWGACVCWVIVACVCGYGGPVNAILSWSPFVSLGRLTYMAYLIHPTVIRAYFENMDQLFYLNDTNFVISYIGILVFTNMASFVLVLGFESPMIGLEKVFLGQH